MTDEEALSLKEGAPVEVFVKSREVWLAGVLCWVVDLRDSWRACVLCKVRTRLPGETRRGKGYRYCRKPAADVRLPLTDAAPEPANVYADFLEENGFPDAAAALRKAFPLDGGEGR